MVKIYKLRSDHVLDHAAFELKKYAFVSDYARLWIIYNYGGISLDTDDELIKSIDDS